MRPLRRAGLALALGGVLAASAAPTFATDNGTVDAQVTVATPCVTVGPALDYGVLQFGAPGGDSSSFTSCSNALETIHFRGTAATSTSSAATWQLTGSDPCTAGVNLYRHYAGVEGLAIVLTLSDQQVTTAAAGVTTALLTAIDMPCSGSDGAGETMTMQIVVTATF